MLNRLQDVDDVLKVFGGVERYKCVVKNDWLGLCRSSVWSVEGLFSST